MSYFTFKSILLNFDMKDKKKNMRSLRVLTFDYLVLL